MMSRPFGGDNTTTHTITSISFSYRYVVGYGSQPDSTGASVSLVWSDARCGGQSYASLYDSPRYLTPSYDKCHDCYSDPVHVKVDGLSLKVQPADSVSLGFRFDNGDHNLQILLPLNLTLTWV